MECTNFWNNVDERLGSVCIRSRTDDEIDETLGKERLQRKQGVSVVIGWWNWSPEVILKEMFEQCRVIKVLILLAGAALALISTLF